MRLGIAKYEKLRFSFVSALAFYYICNRKWQAQWRGHSALRTAAKPQRILLMKK